MRSKTFLRISRHTALRPISSKALEDVSKKQKERVKLAELRAEKSMLEQIHVLRAAEENLNLEIKLAKATSVDAND